MKRTGYKTSERVPVELLCLATFIVQHCAGIAENVERKEVPRAKQLVTGAQIHAEWGLG